MTDERRRGFATRAIHVRPPEVRQQTPSPPIFQTATFRFGSSREYAETIAFRRPGYTYTRGYGNPTLEAFERAVADLEDAQAGLSFGSGMAAIHTAITTLARSGDRVVASRELYGGTYSLFTKILPRYGIQVELVDPHDPSAVGRALPGAAAFYVETIANPSATVADLETLGQLCAGSGVPGVVDNTFASPYLCTPIRYGFDLVLHSATKYLGGHHDLTAGVVCGSEGRVRALRDTVIDTGGTLGPFDAWLALRGMMTLELRMERHSASALALAEHLQAHPEVERVHHPGLASHPQHAVAERLLPKGSGGMLAFEVAGGVEAGTRFCDALELAWVATSLGGTHTLVGHAASTTHRQMDPERRRAAGIGDGLVRVSVGLEDLDDLVADFDRALAAL